MYTRPKISLKLSEQSIPIGKKKDWTSEKSLLGYLCAYHYILYQIKRTKFIVIAQCHCSAAQWLFECVEVSRNTNMQRNKSSEICWLHSMEDDIDSSCKHSINIPISPPIMMRSGDFVSRRLITRSLFIALKSRKAHGVSVQNEMSQVHTSICLNLPDDPRWPQ